MARIDENIKIMMLKGEKGEKGETGYPSDGQISALIGEYINNHPDIMIDEATIEKATKEWLDTQPIPPINDDETAANSTWSSQKIKNEIGDKKRHFILIGDSYCTDRTVDGNVIEGWGSQLKSKITNSFMGDAVVLAKGGTAFTENTGLTDEKSFLDMLRKAYPTKNAETLKITDVVVGGGYNEDTTNTSKIGTAISNFLSYVKVIFPNAKVWIGMFGVSLSDANKMKTLRESVLPFYKGADAIFIEGSNNALHSTYDVTSDYFHPSIGGVTEIVKCIYKCINGGSYRVHTKELMVQNNASGVTCNGYIERDDDNILISINDIVFDTAQDTVVNSTPRTIIVNNQYKAGLGNMIRPIGDERFSQNVPFVIKTSDNKFYNVSGFVGLDTYGNITVRVYAITDTNNGWKNYSVKEIHRVNCFMVIPATMC